MVMQLFSDHLGVSLVANLDVAMTCSRLNSLMSIVLYTIYSYICLLVVCFFWLPLRLASCPYSPYAPGTCRVIPSRLKGSGGRWRKSELYIFVLFIFADAAKAALTLLPLHS